MSGLNLGSFLGGFAQGAEQSMRLNNMKDDEAWQKKYRARQEKEWARQDDLTERQNRVKAELQAYMQDRLTVKPDMEQPQPTSAAFSPNPNGLSLGAVNRQVAELVAAPEANPNGMGYVNMTASVEPALGAAKPVPQAPRFREMSNDDAIDFARKQSQLYLREGLTDDADKAFNRQIALAERKFNMESRERSQAALEASNALARGDYTAAMNLHSKYFPDGLEATGFTKTKDGKIVFNMVDQVTGEPRGQSQPMSQEQLAMLTETMNNPAALSKFYADQETRRFNNAKLDIERQRLAVENKRADAAMLVAGAKGGDKRSEAEGKLLDDFRSFAATNLKGGAMTDINTDTSALLDDLVSQAAQIIRERKAAGKEMPNAAELYTEARKRSKLPQLPSNQQATRHDFSRFWGGNKQQESGNLSTPKAQQPASSKSAPRRQPSINEANYLLARLRNAEGMNEYNDAVESFDEVYGDGAAQKVIESNDATISLNNIMGR